MNSLQVGKALGKVEKCLLIHCFDQTNARKFYPKESDYAATVPFSRRKTVLMPSKFRLRGNFLIEYIDLPTYERMETLHKVCGKLKGYTQVYRYNILDRLPLYSKEKTEVFRNIPITDRNNTLFEDE